MTLRDYLESRDYTSISTEDNTKMIFLSNDSTYSIRIELPTQLPFDVVVSGSVRSVFHLVYHIEPFGSREEGIS
jgi:hypothetical protein